VLQIAVSEQIVRRQQFGDVVDQANQLTVAISVGDRHRCQSRAGFHRKEKARPAVAAGRDRRVRRDRSKPLSGAIVRQPAIHRDHKMTLDVFGSLRRTMALDIGAARVDCPARFSNLAADKVFVRGLAGANSNISLTLCEIEIVITSSRARPLGPGAVRGIHRSEASWSTDEPPWSGMSGEVYR
jgi:hypothetical protein